MRDTVVIACAIWYTVCFVRPCTATEYGIVHALQYHRAAALSLRSQSSAPYVKQPTSALSPYHLAVHLQDDDDKPYIKITNLNLSAENTPGTTLCISLKGTREGGMCPTLSALANNKTRDQGVLEFGLYDRKVVYECCPVRTGSGAVVYGTGHHTRSKRTAGLFTVGVGRGGDAEGGFWVRDGPSCGQPTLHPPCCSVTHEVAMALTRTRHYWNAKHAK